MEAGGCTESAEENMGPDAFYVEEVQATLAHLQELGISGLADHWIGTNPGNQIVSPEFNIQKRKSDFLGGFLFRVLKRLFLFVVFRKHNIFQINREFKQNKRFHVEKT